MNGDILSHCGRTIHDTLAAALKPTRRDLQCLSTERLQWPPRQSSWQALSTTMQPPILCTKRLTYLFKSTVRAQLLSPPLHRPTLGDIALGRKALFRTRMMVSAGTALSR